MSSEVISMDIGTEEHGGTTAQNVEASTLLLNQRTTFVTKSISLSLSTDITLLFNIIHLELI
jgi:hypothetical protein